MPLEVSRRDQLRLNGASRPDPTSTARGLPVPNSAKIPVLLLGRLQIPQSHLTQVSIDRENPKFRQLKTEAFWVPLGLSKGTTITDFSPCRARHLAETKSVPREASRRNQVSQAKSKSAAESVLQQKLVSSIIERTGICAAAGVSCGSRGEF